LSSCIGLHSSLVIARLDRAIQYPRACVLAEVSGYWIPAFAGMTAER